MIRQGKLDTRASFLSLLPLHSLFDEASDDGGFDRCAVHAAPDIFESVVLCLFLSSQFPVPRSVSRYAGDVNTFVSRQLRSRSSDGRTSGDERATAENPPL